MKKQGLKIRAALFLVTAALASSPVLTSVAAATKKDVSSAKDKKSALEQEKKKTEEEIEAAAVPATETGLTHAPPSDLTHPVPGSPATESAAAAPPLHPGRREGRSPLAIL